MRYLFSIFIALAMCLPLYAEGQGEAHIYIFKTDSSAYGGVTVQSGATKTVTDESGFANLQLEEGKHKVALSIDGKTLSEFRVNVIAFEVTEAMLTLGDSKSQEEVSVISEEEEAAVVAAEDLDVGDASGSMVGKVIDSKTSKPVVDARVFVRGVNAESRTDENGQFTVELPVGVYALSIIHPEYTSSTLEELLVEQDKQTELVAELLPSAVELEGVSVVAVKITGGVAALVEEERQSKQLLEIIGAEQMSKSGDSDAAAALKRVSGITVVDGKFIYVRGMGERYSNTLIDGLGLPSPIIERRVVPLDLFSADMIESLVVQKTSSADMPAQFGGGLVQIRTKGLPEERLFKLGVSAGYHSESTGDIGYSHIGGDLDYLGFDDGTRDLPASLGGLESSTVNEDGAENIRQIWTPERARIYPEGSASLTYGDKFGERVPIGIFTTLNFSNSTRNREIGVTKYSGRIGNRAPLQIEHDRLETTNTIDLGGALTLGTVIKEKHELQFTSLLIRSTNKRSAYKYGLLSTEHSEGEEYSLAYTEQELQNFSFHGKHEFLDDKMHFNWDASTSTANRDEPDFRYYQLYTDSGNLRFAQDSDVFFQPNELNDEVEDISLSLDYLFQLTDNSSLKVETGFARTSRDREYDARILRYEVGNETGGYPIENYIVEAADPTVNNVFTQSQDSLSSGNFFRFQNAANNGYEASQKINAYYLMLDYENSIIDVNLGLRHEGNEQNISSIVLGAQESGSIENSDDLPSFNFKYKGLDRHQFRLSYAKTLNRPGFNEISRIPLQTLKGDPFYTGSRNISQAEIEHRDFRYEFFFSEDGGADSLTFGIFQKLIDKPIEAYEASSPDTIQYQYGNAEEGKLWGVEFDVRSNMAFVLESMRDYYTSINYTYVESEVNGFIEESFESGSSINAPENGQPLTGQAENVLNVSFGYDDPDSGLNAALLYNYVDERVVALAGSGFPNTILQPTEQLDLVVGAKVRDKYSVKAKLLNILDQKYELQQDGLTVLEYKQGVTFSLGFGVSL